MRHLTPDEIAILRRLEAAGAGRRAMCRALRCGPNTLDRWRRELGLPCRRVNRRGQLVRDCTLALDLVEMGLTCSEAARMTGTPTTTVRRHARRILEPEAVNQCKGKHGWLMYRAVRAGRIEAAKRYLAETARSMLR